MAPAIPPFTRIPIAIIFGLALLVPTIAPAQEDVVQLPAINVESSVKSWRYAETETFVILSQAPEFFTQQVVNALYRSRHLYLPSPLWAQVSAKTTVLVFEAPVYAFVPASLHLVRNGKPGQWQNQVKRTGIDHDVFCINLRHSEWSYSSGFRFETRSLLQLSVPRPAPWLEPALFGDFGVFRQGLYSEPFRADVPPRTRVPRAEWISDQETDAAKSWLDRAVVLERQGRAVGSPAPMKKFMLPVESLFAAPPVEPEQHRRWIAQLGLFARWGMFAERGKYAPGFWQFALRTRTEPVTPELFEDCFGQSMSAARNGMAWHLPLTLELMAVREVRPFALPNIKLRPATKEEVALYRSVWERLAALALDKSEPAVAASWREQARARLDGALGAGWTDSRLLAIRGLLAADMEDNPRAKTLLSRAARQRVNLPSVYVELARLKLSELPSAQLSAGETAGILELLATARTFRPLLPALYELSAETLGRSLPAVFTEDWRQLLQEGAHLFPRERAMMAKIAAVFNARGFAAEAVLVQKRSHAFVNETRVHESLAPRESAATAAIVAEEAPVDR